MPDRVAARARAGINIALVKYWGKRDAALNLPATGSLSVTLAGCGTETRVVFDDARAGEPDRVTVDGAPSTAGFATRVSGFLDLVRARAGLRASATVETRNTVPTAAGLASSASGFAAMAVAATHAAGLMLGAEELSALARRGSGSAARSIFGGYVEMRPGDEHGDGATAVPLLGPDQWPLTLVVALTVSGPKPISSSRAMIATERTSPYYRSWLESVPDDLDEARAAVQARDLERLGRVAERSALRMHASALAADPAILYWRGATVEVIHALRYLRAQGVPVYFTIDAGPHVKAICAPAHGTTVRAALAQVPGVNDTLVLHPGHGAELVTLEAA